MLGMVNDMTRQWLACVAAAAIATGVRAYDWQRYLDFADGHGWNL